MSEQITVLFTQIRRFSGMNADGEYEYWCPQENREYCVTIERIGETLVYLTLPNGFRLGFLPPGHSTNYTVLREGWRQDDGIATLVKPSAPSAPSAPILESALTLEIVPRLPAFATAKRVTFVLPRILNGILVDHGYCNQEISFPPDGCPESPDADDELCGKASFMLKERNGSLRYFCTSFRVDNKTSNKNLTLQYGCGSVLAV